MLNMLNLFWDPPQKSAQNRGNVKYVKYVKCLGGNPPPQRGQHLTYLTVPLF